MLSTGWTQQNQLKNKLKVRSIYFFFFFTLTKKFVEQTVGPPYTLRLKVKFYSSEPHTLREELTRYQFFLQLKLDLLDGRLECPDDKAVELAALALQCKLISWFVGCYVFCYLSLFI